MKKIFFVILILFLFSHFSYSQPSTFFKMYNQGNSGYAVRELNGNSYVVAGGTDFYYNFHWFIMSSLSTTNVHLFKTSSNGNLLWERIFNSPNHRMLSTWMETLSDGGIIVTGHISDEKVWPPDSNDIFLMKSDGNGNLLWAKTFDTGKDDLGFCVRQTADGGFIVSGFHDALPTSLTGSTYAILIKTDSNGSVEWEKKYQIPVRDLDTGEGLPVLVNQTADGGFVVTGTTAASHAADVFVFRTDGFGNLIWAKSYEHDASVFRFSLGLDIVESTSGDLIIAGSMDKDRVLNQFNYPYILRLNTNGTVLDAKILSTVPDQLFQSGFSSVEQTVDGGYFFTGMGGYSSFGSQAEFLKTDNAFNTQWSRVYTMDGVATMGSRSGRSTTDGCYVFTGKRQLSGTVLMKTDNLGLIPCKTPTSLVEIIPSVFSQLRFPSVFSGINSNTLLLNTQVSLEDTATICPVLITSLPIELISFVITDAGKNRVRIDWKTGAEINSDRFIIEESDDGGDFYEIGSVKGAGNSDKMNYYTFNSDYPNQINILYFRLKEVDFDGTVSYSEIKTFYIRNLPVEVLFSTVNYHDQNINISLAADYSGKFNYYFTDLFGREYKKGESKTLNHENRIILETGNLVKGVYFLNLIFNDKVVVVKMYY